MVYVSESLALKTIRDNRNKAVSLATKYVGRANAEDIVQEASIKMMSVVRKGKCTFPCDNYFLKAVSNCSISMARAKKRAPELQVIDEMVELMIDTRTFDNPNDMLEASALLDLVNSACVSDHDKRLLEMLANSCSYEDIYAELGVGRSGIFRFRERLAKTLEEQDLLNGYKSRRSHKVCA